MGTCASSAADLPVQRGKPRGRRIASSRSVSSMQASASETASICSGPTRQGDGASHKTNQVGASRGGGAGAAERNPLVPPPPPPSSTEPSGGQGPQTIAPLFSASSSSCRSSLPSRTASRACSGNEAAAVAQPQQELLHSHDMSDKDAPYSGRARSCEAFSLALIAGHTDSESFDSTQGGGGLSDSTRTRSSLMQRVSASRATSDVRCGSSTGGVGGRQGRGCEQPVAVVEAAASLGVARQLLVNVAAHEQRAEGCRPRPVQSLQGAAADRSSSSSTSSSSSSSTAQDHDHSGATHSTTSTCQGHRAPCSTTHTREPSVGVECWTHQGSGASAAAVGPAAAVTSLGAGAQQQQQQQRSEDNAPSDGHESDEVGKIVLAREGDGTMTLTATAHATEVARASAAAVEEEDECMAYFACNQCIEDTAPCTAATASPPPPQHQLANNPEEMPLPVLGRALWNNNDTSTTGSEAPSSTTSLEFVGAGTMMNFHPAALAARRSVSSAGTALGPSPLSKKGERTAISGATATNGGDAGSVTGTRASSAGRVPRAPLVWFPTSSPSSVPAVGTSPPPRAPTSATAAASANSVEKSPVAHNMCDDSPSTGMVLPNQGCARATPRSASLSPKTPQLLGARAQAGTAVGFAELPMALPLGPRHSRGTPSPLDAVGTSFSASARWRERERAVKFGAIEELSLTRCDDVVVRDIHRFARSYQQDQHVALVSGARAALRGSVAPVDPSATQGSGSGPHAARPAGSIDLSKLMLTQFEHVGEFSIGDDSNFSLCSDAVASFSGGRSRNSLSLQREASFADVRPAEPKNSEE